MIEPIIIRGGKKAAQQLEKLKHHYPIWKTIDILDDQHKELFEITHANLTKNPTYQRKLEKFLKSKRTKNDIWIYFPWNGILLHAVHENEYNLLRTNRNKNLITSKEQTILHNTCIGIAGLSVGSSIATTLAYQGIGNTLKLAEFDTLETTNLNRLRAKIYNVGQSKIEIIAHELYEVNPFIKLITYPEGLTKNNLASFVEGHPTPRCIFEIIDDFEMKILLRLAARKAKIPVISTANLGDHILFDVERYDLNPALPLFNGVLGDMPEEILKHPNLDKHSYAVKMVGIDHVPMRARESVKQIGKTLVGRPQLATTVTISGALSTYLCRRIILKKPVPSGRTYVSFSHAMLLIDDTIEFDL